MFRRWGWRLTLSPTREAVTRLAKPSLMPGGRARGLCEAFVASGVSKTRHAVAIADGRRSSEVRLAGETASCGGG